MENSELVLGSKVWFNHIDKTYSGNGMIGWVRNINGEDVTVNTTRKGLIVIKAFEIYQQKTK